MTKHRPVKLADHARQLLQHAQEFTCTECGREIVRLDPTPVAFGLCGLCLHIPGWYRFPELRARLDPEYDTKC